MTARAECGSLAGVLAHEAAYEPPCGWCVQAGRIAALVAEGIPTGLPAPPAKVTEEAPLGKYKPVTAHQASQHRATLLAELDERDQARVLQLVKPETGQSARAS